MRVDRLLRSRPCPVGDAAGQRIGRILDDTDTANAEFLVLDEACDLRHVAERDGRRSKGEARRSLFDVASLIGLETEKADAGHVEGAFALDDAGGIGQAGVTDDMPYQLLFAAARIAHDFAVARFAGLENDVVEFVAAGQRRRRRRIGAEGVGSVRRRRGIHRRDDAAAAVDVDREGAVERCPQTVHRRRGLDRLGDKLAYFAGACGGPDAQVDRSRIRVAVGVAANEGTLHPVGVVQIDFEIVDGYAARPRDCQHPPRQVADQAGIEEAEREGGNVVGTEMFAFVGRQAPDAASLTFMDDALLAELGELAGLRDQYVAAVLLHQQRRTRGTLAETEGKRVA